MQEEIRLFGVHNLLSAHPLISFNANTATKSAQFALIPLDITSVMDKIYFYDLGVRNILIDNLKPLKDRNDTGQIWENFLIAERMKKLAYYQIFASIYFWRTYTGAELDYVEEKGGALYGFEFKYGEKTVKAPKAWFTTYPNSKFSLVNRKNYLDFILNKSQSTSQI